MMAKTVLIVVLVALVIIEETVNMLTVGAAVMVSIRQGQW